MNMKLVIIGVVLVLLLVAFGRDPTEDKKRYREEKMGGKDPLVYSIEEQQKSRGRSTRTSMPEGAEKVGNPPGFGNSPDTFQPPSNPPATMPTPQGGGYYPPPANSTPNNFNPVGPGSENFYKLPDGRRYVFSGTKVYTFDTSGNRIPLEDGVYPVFGGHMLTVKNGEKISLDTSPRS